MLKVSWKAIDFLFNGKVANESDINVPRPTDTNVSVMPVERCRTFRLNEFVEFSQMDLSEICWNYSAIAQDIVRGAQQKAASMIAKSGVP